MLNQSCRYCGCTNDRACPGGCHWHKEQYCSACAQKHIEQLGTACAIWSWAQEAGNHDFSSSLGKWPVRIERLADSSIAVFDHLGTNVLYWTPAEIAIAPHYDAPELMPLFARAA